MKMHGGAARLAPPGGRRRPLWRSAVLVMLMIGVPLAGIASPIGVEPAGAQGGWINGSTAVTSEIWENYSGWSWPSWQIAGGGDAGFRAYVRLDYPAYIRAGQPFSYRRCVTRIETNETNIYETAINGVSLTGSIEMTGTAYSQGGWSGTGASVCQQYTATAPTSTGSQTVSLPSAWLRPSQAVGYAGSCCGGFGWRGYAGTTNNQFTTMVLQNPVAVNDTASVAQGGMISLTPTANDTGFSGANSGTVTGLVITANGTKGTCVASGTTVYYFHSGGATGTDTCTYAVNQAETDDVAPSNGTVSATITFTISGPPVATDDAQSTTEDVPLTFDPRTNDTDPESGALTITAVDTAGTQGTVTFTGTSLTYDPGATFQYLQVGQSATTTFKYTIADPSGVTDVGQVTMTITGVNDAPIAVADAFATGENGPSITYDVRTNDSDVDAGDTKTVTAVNTTGTQGTVTFTGTGVTYTPSGYDYLAAGETATTTFTYTVTDSQGASATATVTVTISGSNDAPVVVADTATVGEAGPAVDVTPLANDTDPDTSNTLALQTASLLSGQGTVSFAGDTVTYDPAGNYEYLSVGDTATVLVSYTAVDSAGTTSTGTITVTVTGENDDPTAVDDTATANEDGPSVSIDVLTAGVNDSDIDLNDTLSVTTVGTPSAGTATLSGNTVTYDPAGAFENLGVGQTGTATFTYDIADGQGGTSTATVTVTVFGANDLPTPVDDLVNVPEDGPALTIDPLANDTDPDDGDSLTIFEVGTATHGVVTWTDGDSTFTYLPDPAFYNYLAVGETQTDTFTYTVVDSNNAVTTATVTVTIDGVNDTPAAADDTGTTDEETPVTIDVVAPNDTDPDTSDVLNVGAVTQPATGGTVTFVGAEVTFDPGTAYQDLAVGETRDAVFTYTVDDGNGGTDDATVTITVSGVNDGPDAVDDVATSDEDVVLTLDVVAPNDTDVDASDVLTISAVTQPVAGGTVTFAGTEISFDPGTAYQDLAVGETRDAVFAYTIDDGNGGTDTAVVTITIAGVNDDPVATDDATSTTEDAPVSIDVLTAGIADSDIDASDVLAVDSIDTAGTLGSAVLAGSIVTYDPGTAFQYLAAGESATDTFTYTISDGNGGTATATVTITITGVNDGPDAVDDAGTTTEALPLTVDVVGPNDTDPDTSDDLNITAVTQPATGGTVTFAGKEITFDPGTAYADLAVGETRDAVFTYTIDDGNGGTDTATVTITVTGGNNVPVATDDAATTDEESPVTVDVVAPNDTDVDGTDVLAVTEITQPAEGGVVTVDGNEITFDPADDFQDLAAGETRDAVFTYTIDDGNGGTAAATVTVTVTGVNDDGVGVDDAYGTDDVTSITVDPVASNDTDPDTSDALTITGVDTTGVLGSVTFTGNDVTYDPAGVWNQIGSTMSMLLFDDQTATETFTYTVTDGNGWTDTVTVTVTVSGTLSRTADSDGGGVPDWVELLLGTDPTDPSDDPLYQDSDGGGVPDWIEIIQGTDPTDPSDDLVDLDTDGGGVPDWIEYLMDTDINNPADDPLDVDTDGNGIPDWHEYATCGSVGCEELPAAPGECPTPNDLLELVKGTLAAGETVQVRGSSAWLPHSKVSYFVCSTPILLDAVTAGADGLGLATLAIPSDIDPGDHLVFGLGIDGNGEPALKTIGFTVAETPVPTTAAPTTAAPTTTAAVVKVAGKTQKATPAVRTGASVGVSLLAGGCLLALGSALLAVTRRRQHAGSEG